MAEKLDKDKGFPYEYECLVRSWTQRFIDNAQSRPGSEIGPLLEQVLKIRRDVQEKIMQMNFLSYSHCYEMFQNYEKINDRYLWEIMSLVNTELPPDLYQIFRMICKVRLQLEESERNSLKESISVKKRRIR